jgi:hypothetical protein
LHAPGDDLRAQGEARALASKLLDLIVGYVAEL